MSRAGGRDVAVAMRDCGISTTSQTRPVCKHCFSALPIDKTSSVEAHIGLLWRSFSHLATGCGIKARDPEGLDSDRWIPHSRCCENPARTKALAGFSRHLSAGFTDLNPAPRGLSLPLPWASGLPVAFQWQSSVPGTQTPVYTGMPLEKCQCASSGVPVVFQWLSSGLPVCSNYAN